MRRPRRPMSSERRSLLAEIERELTAAWHGLLGSLSQPIYTARPGGL